MEGALTMLVHAIIIAIFLYVVDKVYFIVSDRAASGGGPAVWAELDQETHPSQLDVTTLA